jgi:hypothetical protein
MSRALRSLLLVLAASLALMSGCRSGFPGTYEACSMQCETLVLRPDHTFSLTLTGDLATGESTTGTWEAVESRRHVIRLTLAKPKERSTIEVLPPSEASGEGIQITVTGEIGPLPGAIATIYCDGGEALASISVRTDATGRAKAPPCAATFVSVEFGGLDPVSQTFSPAAARQLSLRAHLVEPQTFVRDGEEWLIERGAAYQLASWPLPRQR